MKRVSEGPIDSLSERRIHTQGPPRLEIDNWRERFGVVAGITGADEGFDLGLWGSKPAGDVMRNWRSFQESIGPQFRQYVVSHQQHGKLVGMVRGGQNGLIVRTGFDGHSTGDKGILLVVLVADCVPVYLFDTKSGSVALLHAGWRGIAAGVLESGLEQLRAIGLRRASDLVMHCGVSVCGDCYEVGPEVVRSVLDIRVDSPTTLDLRSALVNRALNCGIEQITVSEHCTMHDSGQFHSHRAKGEESGRMAAYLGMPLS